MFTPKNIQGALEELYDLCDPDYMVDMLVNYSEEFDDISPALLAKSFQKNAEMVSEYRVLSSAGEGIDYQGKVLLNSRAVRLLSYVEDMSGDEKVRTIQSKELWLAEDMTFYVVSCMSTITMDKEEAICLNRTPQRGYYGGMRGRYFLRHGFPDLRTGRYLLVRAFSRCGCDYL